MVSNKTYPHPKGDIARLINILPYSIDATNDKLIPRADVLSIVQLMSDLKLQEQLFTSPKRNRGFNPSAFTQTFILMQHEAVRLDDVRHLNKDDALNTILELTVTPKANTLGSWLRKMEKDKNSLDA